MTTDMINHTKLPTLLDGTNDPQRLDGPEDTVAIFSMSATDHHPGLPYTL